MAYEVRLSDGDFRYMFNFGTSETILETVEKSSFYRIHH